MLVAQPAPNVFQEKDVFLLEFVVPIFIQYVYELLSIQTHKYLIIICIILMVYELLLTRKILYLQILPAQPVLIVFLVKDVVLTRFAVSIFID